MLARSANPSTVLPTSNIPFRIRPAPIDTHHQHRHGSACGEAVGTRLIKLLAVYQPHSGRDQRRCGIGWLRLSGVDACAWMVVMTYQDCAVRSRNTHFGAWFHSPQYPCLAAFFRIPPLPIKTPRLLSYITMRPARTAQLDGAKHTLQHAQRCLRCAWLRPQCRAHRSQHATPSADC